MLKGLNQSKYSIEQIFENQMATPSIKNLLFALHENIIQNLQQKNSDWIARTHVIGITYLCNKRKAFMFVNVRQQFLSIKFFTGKSRIDGLQKGIWLKRGDNIGSKPHRIVDSTSLNHALLFAMKAYEIAKNWAS